jgi:hypothetical protein
VFNFNKLKNCGFSYFELTGIGLCAKTIPELKAPVLRLDWPVKGDFVGAVVRNTSYNVQTFPQVKVLESVFLVIHITIIPFLKLCIKMDVLNWEMTGFTESEKINALNFSII